MAKWNHPSHEQGHGGRARYSTHGIRNGDRPNAAEETAEAIRLFLEQGGDPRLLGGYGAVLVPETPDGCHLTQDKSRASPGRVYVSRPEGASPNNGLGIPPEVLERIVAGDPRASTKVSSEQVPY